MNKEEFIERLKEKGFRTGKDDILEKEEKTSKGTVIIYVNVVSEYKVFVTASLNGVMTNATAEMTVNQYEESENFGIDVLAHIINRIIGL